VLKPSLGSTGRQGSDTVLPVGVSSFVFKFLEVEGSNWREEEREKEREKKNPCTCPLSLALSKKNFLFG
jgi:hypothetical protein